MLCSYMICMNHNFNNIGNGVGKDGVSAINELKLLRGRPNGGAAIVWNRNLKTEVVPDEHKIDRVCTVTVDINE